MNPLLRRLAEIRRRFLVRWEERRLRAQRHREQNPDQVDANNAALIGLFLFFFLLIDVVIVAERVFDQGRSTQGLINSVLGGNPIFARLLEWLIRPLVTILHPVNLRFLLAPLAAILIVWVAAANYVRGMFNVPTFRMSLDHIFAALFYTNLSNMRISQGKAVTTPGVPNKIEIIGGPGYLEVEQDSAVLVRGPTGNLRHASGRIFYVRNFERIVSMISTEDQHQVFENNNLTTSDGLRVELKNMQYRYRVLPPEGENQGRRSLSNPYPISQDAFRNMMYNTNVIADGTMNWDIAIRNAVSGVVETFIRSHTLDECTAPHTVGGDPRRQMRNSAFMPELTNILRNIGAQLIWMDPGFIHIVEPDVDNSRINLWGADTSGASKAMRGYADARVSMYREQGRAEGQAEMIIAIANALSKVEQGGNRVQALRNILLFRTGQIFQAMADNEPSEESPE